ncbi:MAG: hypothetical protein Q7P63_14975 [Verrucomicrobiota bacterium JB022]|nr:hypothetical protein [Verrucomicrobiota bacterium JB022]
MLNQLKAFCAAFKVSTRDTSPTALATLYRSMSDQTLLEINPAHLTAEALPVWQAEMRARNLARKAV